MSTVALDVLDWLDHHPAASAATKRRLLAQVPAWQWATPGGHWRDLARHCCNRIQPSAERRPVNGLNIEIGTPAARCLFRSPDGHGVTKDGSTLDWLRSGGDVLAYGRCEQCAGPRTQEAA